MAEMDIETSNDLIEEILATWKDRIGDDYPGYRGHIYRMFNFCQALRLCSEEEKTKLAIAACHHDIGLWSAHTVDYIPPSVVEVNRISGYSRDIWGPSISGIPSEPWQGMKMDRCVRCHAEQNRVDGCVACHK